MRSRILSAVCILGLGVGAMSYSPRAAYSASPPEIDWTIRRLPPLTYTSEPAASTMRQMLRGPALPNPAVSSIAPPATGIQLVNAVQPSTANYSGLEVRRLPPIITFDAQDASKGPHAASPAHAKLNSPADHRPGTGVARVLPGTFAIAGRAVYLGPPPAPATDPGSLSDVGRASLATTGQVPKESPSPKQAARLTGDLPDATMLRR